MMLDRKRKILFITNEQTCNDSLLCVGIAAHAEQLRQRAFSLVTFFGQAKKVIMKIIEKRNKN
jgi:hypothetical protein